MGARKPEGLGAQKAREMADAADPQETARLTEQQAKFAGPPLPDKAQEAHEVSIGATEPKYVDRWGSHPARTAGTAVAEGRANDDGLDLAAKSDATPEEIAALRKAAGREG